MKKILYSMLMLVSIFIYHSVSAQDSSQTAPKQRPLFMDKVFFGGYFGLGFGTVTNIELSPQVGYHLTSWFDAGVGGSYRYYSDSRYNFSTQMYGGNAFTRLFVFDNLFAYAEAEQLSLEALNLQNEYQRMWITSVFVGGGYRQKMGDRFAMNLMVLWNINPSIYSPYVNPIIRMGFNF